MARMTATQKAGLAVLVLSPVVGLAGTAWSIYSSFAALESAENAGIGSVGDEIGKAVVFTVGGLVGSAIGLMLIILGRSKANRV
jgi:biopolymer transport protein ExbB/TolQ